MKCLITYRIQTRQATLLFDFFPDCGQLGNIVCDPEDGSFIVPNWCKRDLSRLEDALVPVGIGKGFLGLVYRFVCFEDLFIIFGKRLDFVRIG